MTIVKVIEVIASSPTSIEDARLRPYNAVN